MTKIGTIRGLTVFVHSRRILLVGLGLIALSFCMPQLFTVENVQVRHFLHLALINGERLDLINAALRLVVLNTVRALPHYCGAFLVADALEFRWNGREAWFCNAGLILLLLYATYRSIHLAYGIYYDFGLPAITAAFFIILFIKLNYRYISSIKKTLFVTMELAAWQFLDIMPSASFLPVGRGEISIAIKLAGRLLDGESALDTMGTIGIFSFAFCAVLLFILLRDENYLREIDALKEQNSAIQAKSHLNEMRTRTYQEIQHLVHDLKSPLTVVQTLVGACKLKCEQNGELEQLELLGRVENSVDHMSQMISEILYQDKTSLVSVEKLLNRVLAQISIENYAPYVHLEMDVPKARIRVNGILFSRVLVNLVQNAANAIETSRAPNITIRAGMDGAWVRFQVIDNGTGIEIQKLKDIWTRGYSGGGSSGLGLFFVRDVVERFNGIIDLWSEVGKGTVITIKIPKEAREDGPETKRDDSVH